MTPDKGTLAPKSFYTIKVDNYDMAEKNVRIIDFKGQPNSQGRVEFRNNGEWGTGCARGSEENAVRTICR
jgi:hypothetical protein